MKSSITFALALVMMFSSVACTESYGVIANAASKKTEATTQSKYVIKLKASDTSSVKLSWKKTKRATGYRLYKYNTKTKKWEKIKTTSKISYTVKNLKAGTTYKFRVRSYTKNGKKTTWGKYYETVKVTTKPAKVKKLTTNFVTVNSVGLSWKKVTGATGYRVYKYNTKTKKWVKIKTTKSTSYTVNKLKSGSTYKFRVKAYKKLNGKTYWGSASETLTVKVAKPNPVPGATVPETVVTENNETTTPEAKPTTFKEAIGVYDIRNLPSEHPLYEDRCAAWISIYTVGKNDGIESEMKSKFKDNFGYEAQEKVVCTCVGDYYVEGYNGVQKVYQYSIEDYTYPLIVDEFYKLSYSVCMDGSPWVGYCIPQENYWESDKNAELSSKIDRYFCEISGYNSKYIMEHEDDFTGSSWVCWSGPYRTKDGKIIDQIVWCYVRGFDVPFKKDIECNYCGEHIPAGALHTWKECKYYSDPVFRQHCMEELVK